MRQRGFTLLEIMVVITVMAILSAALVLSARGGGSDRQVEDEARRLQRVLQLLCDEAVIEGRYAGFGYGASLYAGFELTPQGWKETKRGALRMHKLISGLFISEFGVDEALPAALPNEPQLMCAPTGELGDFDLLLLPNGSSKGWRFGWDKQGEGQMIAWEPR